MTTKQIKQLLEDNDVRPSSLSKKNGIYTARFGFFYTHGKTSDDFAKCINSIDTLQVIDHGEVWKDFKGGAPVHQQSHWWVKFEIA